MLLNGRCVWVKVQLFSRVGRVFCHVIRTRFNKVTVWQSSQLFSGCRISFSHAKRDFHFTWVWLLWRRIDGVTNYRWHTVWSADKVTKWAHGDDKWLDWSRNSAPWLGNQTHNGQGPTGVPALCPEMLMRQSTERLKLGVFDSGQAAWWACTLVLVPSRQLF